MEALTTLLSFVGLATVAAFVWKARRVRTDLERRLRYAWHVAAGRLGLQVIYDRPAAVGSEVLLARSGALEIEAALATEVSEAATRLTVRGLGHGSPGLSVKPRGFGAGLTERLGGESLELGSPDFDQRFVVQGDPLRAQAVFDAETRALLVKVFESRAKLAASVLEVVTPHGDPTQAELLAELLVAAWEPALRLAGRLVEPTDLAGRLAGNLGLRGRRKEPEGGVRLRTLRWLLREFRQHPATEKVLELLEEDQSPAVRLEVELARGRADEATLLPHLESQEEAVVLIAARALGTLGSAAAVPALRGLEAREDAELSRAATQAIAEIQARLDGAERGQLSLAGAEVGALSLAEAHEAGRLTLRKEKD